MNALPYPTTMNAVTNAEERWQAILENDQRYDGAFVYAVRSTGIYCRPSCHSKKPNRENVLFFPLNEIAERAGYRPCKRCQPERAGSPSPEVELARRVCRLIEAHLDEKMTLESLAGASHLSPSHLQRTFKDVVGITPHEYMEACRMEQVRLALNEGAGILDTIFAVGYSSTSRLYEKALGQLGMTPGDYRQGGSGRHILYATAPCSLGILLAAATSQGICAVQLGETEDGLEQSLQAQFPQAILERGQQALGGWLGEILDYLEGEQPHPQLPLGVQATAFQRRVWQALQAIPYGSTRTYRELAQAIGQPDAARAVGQACASNPVALLIPCHRAIRSDGGLGGYRWGVERKRSLLERERAAVKNEQTLLERSPGLAG